MAMFHGIVLICICFQAASALRVGNYPQYRANDTVLPEKIQLRLFARIISRYDIVAVPNIADPTELLEVERMLREENSHYRFYLSTRLLKPTLPSIDYYGVFYKSNVVYVSDFIRDQPTGAVAMKVHVQNTGQEFVMSLVHLSGSEVVTELENLPAAFDRLQEYFKLESILFIGDFNTFPNFITTEQHDNAFVTRDARYHWFIQRTDNTFIPVVPYLQGAAARFLARGPIANWVEPNTVRVLDVRDHFGLTFSEAAGMNAFLPVELELREPILKQWTQG